MSYVHSGSTLRASSVRYGDVLSLYLHIYLSCPTSLFQGACLCVVSVCVCVHLYEDVGCVASMSGCRTISSQHAHQAECYPPSCTPVCTGKCRRHTAYISFARAHGITGRGERAVLPSCVMRYIAARAGRSEVGFRVAPADVDVIAAVTESKSKRTRRK